MRTVNHYTVITGLASCHCPPLSLLQEPDAVAAHTAAGQELQPQDPGAPARSEAAPLVAASGNAAAAVAEVRACCEVVAPLCR